MGICWVAIFVFSYSHISHTQKRKMKKNEFHIPFIKNLLFVGLVTIVSMISVRYFIINYHFSLLKFPEYTTLKSQLYPDSRD
jgi:hypothetical protein